MNTLRLSTLSLTLAMAVMTLSYVNPTSAASPGGFRLTGADAAFADWVAEGLEGCDVRLFVGFVEADALQLPLGSKPHPHSDVNAVLAVDCGIEHWDFVGVTSAEDCVPPPEMMSLESAVVSCAIDISGGGGTGVVRITGLRWTAEGRIFTETSHGPGIHAAHRTRTATVEGEVTIEVDVRPLFATFKGSEAEDDARITHYNEIQL